MDRLFPAAVLDALDRAGDRTCFEHGQRRTSGTQALAMVSRFGGALRAAGLRSGDGIALLPGVSVEGFAAMFAAYTLGLRVSQVRPGLTPAHLAHLVGEGADAVVYDPSAAPPELLAAAGAVPRLSLGASAGATDLLAYRGAGIDLAPAGDPAAIGRITYTSGSTGTPKGVAATYRALTIDWPANRDRWSPAHRDLTSRLDRFLTFGTLASQAMLNYVLATLAHGGVVVIPDEFPQPFLPGALERFGITASILNVPRLYQMLDFLRDNPMDLSAVRMLMVSGSPVSPRRLAAAVDLLGPVFFQGYGQTEAGTLTMLTPTDLAGGDPEVFGTVGRPVPGVELELRDEHDRPVPAGQTGEIYARTPWQSGGYWLDPEQTAQVYRDGWVRTRDLGYLDGAGYLHLAGRTRDVIIVNAFVYYAGPIEQVLARHPDVDQAYVTGAPDERTGEAIHAFVVPVPGRVPDPAALDKLVRAELGDAHAPATITMIPEVVAAPSGKPDKPATLARYLPRP